MRSLIPKICLAVCILACLVGIWACGAWEHLMIGLVGAFLFVPWFALIGLWYMWKAAQTGTRLEQERRERCEECRDQLQNALLGQPKEPEG